MKSITRPPEHALEIFQSSVDRALDRHRLTNQLVRQFKSTTFLAFANLPGMRRKMVPNLVSTNFESAGFAGLSNLVGVR
jgi:hypothetical protein